LCVTHLKINKQCNILIKVKSTSPT